MSLIVQSLSQAITSRAVKKLREASFNPLPFQQRALVNLRALCRQSPRTRGSEFHSQISISEMKQLSPTNFENYKDEIELFRNGPCGNTDFKGSKTRLMALTSGTMGNPKYIPLNQSYISAYKNFTLSMTGCFLNSTGVKKSIFAGKLLYLASPQSIGTSPNGITEGYVSGFMATNVPFFYKSKILPSHEVFNIANWSEKMERILSDHHLKDVTAIIGLPIHIYALMEVGIQRFGKENLQTLFPKLRGVLTSGSTFNESQKQEIEKYFCQPNARLAHFEMYAATECQIGHSFHPEWPGLIFNPFHNFYQFTDDQSSIPLQLHELQQGKAYAILITTPGGLVNYRLGDWIEVTSANPLTFKVLKRDGESIDLFGKQIHCADIIAAMSSIDPSGLNYAFWVDPQDANQLCCVMNKMFKQDGRDLSEIIDRGLIRASPGYQCLREIEFYKKVKIHFIENHYFESYRAKHMSRGQFKQRIIFKSKSDLLNTYQLNSELI